MLKAMISKYKYTHLTPRQYMVLILTLVASTLTFQGLLLPKSAQSIITAYRWQISNGQSYGGFTTNWTEVCGDQPSLSSLRVTTMTTSAFPCDDRIQRTASSVPTDMLLMIKPTAYSAPTLVKGQATGNRWYLRDGGTANSKVVRFSLGYVSGGAFTAFGFVDVTVNNGTRALYQPNMSGIQGTAPAGSYLAVKVTIQSDTSDYLRIYLADANANGDQSGQISVDETAGDTTAPSVSAFTMPATSTSLTVPVSTFTATDNTGVTGYLITESATAPAAGAAGWTATAPSSFTFGGEGTRTTYAWAKDAAGNVSASRSATVAITLPDTTAPTITTFAMTTPVTSPVNVPVTAFTATDNVGVTGYLITETATPPSIAAAGWTATAPTLFSFSGFGTRIAYAWVKDAAGNVSASATATVAINDAEAPSLTLFSVPTTSSSLTVTITAFTATDNVGVTGWLVKENGTTPLAGDAGWLASQPSSFSFAAQGLRTAYAWVKDAAGNISNMQSADVAITLPDTTAPTVSSFTMPSTATSLTVPVSTFTATDNTGVTGYLITESATAPASGAAGWTATAPATFTFGGEGARTAYAWAKDGAGNVSASRNATVTITLPDNRTVAGTATAAAAGTSSINVTAPYTGDPNANNTLLVEYKASSAGSYTTWQTISHGASPYATTITGLQAATAYDVRVTYQDSDGIVGTAQQLLNVTTQSAAVNGTTAGTVSGVASSSSSITLTAPYGNDDNASNTLLVEYKTTAAGTYTVWQTLSHAASPYTATITGLQANTAYNVRATYQDGDGVIGSPVQVATVTTPLIDTPLMHSGPNLQSKYGSWGAERDCSWCHNDETNNIKMVQETINTPIGPRPVVFDRITASQLTTPGTFGNDQRPVVTGSQNVCEVCHHQTKFHQYSGSKVAVTTHYNNRDCTLCHTHRSGFRYDGAGGCAACHGNPPLTTTELTTGAIAFSGQPGSHQAHNQRGMGCLACHVNSNGGAMTSGDDRLQIGFNVTGTTVPGFRGSVATGTFTGNGNYPSWVTAPGTTLALAPDTVTCSIYCHGGWSGSGGQITAPSWVGANQASACNACHGDAATPPSAGSHAGHVANQGIGCSTCHGQQPVDTTHMNGQVVWQMPGSGLYKGFNRYSSLSQPLGGSYGSCSNLYCHSDVQGSGGNGGPTSFGSATWGNAGSVTGCAACHQDMQTTGTASHLKHTARYACATCHNGAGSGSTRHADSYIDVSFSGSGSGTIYSQPRTLAGSDGYGSCSNIGCHNNNSAQWGSTLTCVGCHPLAGLQASGAHGKHIAAAPSFYNFTAARSTAGIYDFGCSNCHPQDSAKHANGTIDVTINGTNSGAGGPVGYLRSRNGASADGLAAANGPSGVFGTGRVSVRCSASYCHSNGYADNLRYMVSPDWYGPAYTGDRCAMCHGNSPNANDPVNQPGSPAHYSRNFLGFSNVSGGHVTGIHTNNIFTGTVGLANVGNTPVSSHGNGTTATTINCNMCHYVTVTTYANDRNKACVACHGTLPQNPSELVANKGIHVNGRVDVVFNPIRIRSKAQLREQSYDQTLWSRQAGYKQSGSHDLSFKSFSTATQWDGATKSCSNIACHNGKTVKWGDTSGATSCHSCHDRL